MTGRTTISKLGVRPSRGGTLDDATGARMPICFVIQPFDQGSRFDKRYQDAFKPALAEAGLDAYRVDRDPNAEVLIDAIEKGILRATICLADVTKDNPNVWYELGLAYAARKSVILICGDEREGALPFDIQHRNVIQYKSESANDFEALKQQITERAKTLFERAIKYQMNDADPIAPQAGLPQREIQLLGVVAGATAAPGTRENGIISVSAMRALAFEIMFISMSFVGQSCQTSQNFSPFGRRFVPTR